MGVTVLLDTHAFFWACSAPDRLSSAAHAVVADPTSTLLVSAASAYEVGNKVRLGKWPAADLLARSWPNAIRELGAREAALSAGQMLSASRFDVVHRDPFDRMIAAQAADLGVRVVTRDAAFADLPCDVLW